MIEKEYTAASLSEYYQIVRQISKQSNLKVGCPLWFRGQEDSDYTLLPGFMRNETVSQWQNDDDTYNSINIREEYRVQNYKARTYHVTKVKPTDKIEWLALYQHHFGKTRLMDWSESAKTALSFALEAFIDPCDKKHTRYQRETITPVVWVINPQKLNEKVYDYFSKEKFVVKKALESVGLHKKAYHFCQELRKGKEYLKISPNSEIDIGIDGILNLGVIDDIRKDNASTLRAMVESFELNPFFYLCLRYYVDAIPSEVTWFDQILPPLAITHQYQSERIRAQKGVFTVFPNYRLTEETKKLKLMGCDCRNFENQTNLKGLLSKIRIVNPKEVAKELLIAGERRTEIYPDKQHYAEVLEADKYYV